MTYYQLSQMLRLVDRR